jgi:hypothetical protein
MRPGDEASAPRLALARMMSVLRRRGQPGQLDDREGQQCQTDAHEGIACLMDSKVAADSDQEQDGGEKDGVRM